MPAMTDWQHADLPVDGISIHYARTGTREKPAVVLLHGFTDSGAVWAPLARDLHDDYDLVAIDAVGHGRSGAPDVGFNRARNVTDVIAVIDALGLERPALLGHSMGGSTAAGVAAQAPERVRSLVLEDPPLRDAPPAPNPGGRGVGSLQWINLVERLKREDADGRLAAGRAEHPTWSDDELAPWAESKALFNLDMMAVMRAPQHPQPWRDTYRQIGCPILLITGDPALGGIVTPEVAAAVSEICPAAQIAHIAGTSHNIRRDNYAAFLTAVRPFLAAH